MLGGHAGAGKDTVADYLVEHHGFTKVGMSDALVEMLMILDPIIYGNGVRVSDALGTRSYTDAKAEYPEFRRLLRVFGTDTFRDHVDEDYWVKAALRTIAPLLAANKNVVLTGVRFPNELEIADKCVTFSDPVTAWVSRNDLPSDQHASETSLAIEDFETIIPNIGTLDELYEQAAYALMLPFERSAAVPEIIAQQKVLVDDEVIMTFVSEVPGEPEKAIVEAWGVGPLILEKKRLQPLA